MLGYQLVYTMLRGLAIPLVYTQHVIFYFFSIKNRILRATSHTRLRAHDHSTSSTLMGEKCGAGPSSLHTTLEGPTEYVSAR